MTIFSTTTAPQTTVQATGGCGVRGSRGRTSEGPHHYQKDFIISFLRREPPLLVPKSDDRGGGKGPALNVFQGARHS